MKNVILLLCSFFLFQCSIQKPTQDLEQPNAIDEIQKDDPVESLLALYPQFMTVPNAIDTNQDGSLSAEEVMAAPEQLVTLDKNQDGELNWKEIGAWEEQLPLVRDHNITNLIDENADIHISADEIKNAANSLKQLDFNKDWHISEEELFFNKNKKFPPFTNKKMDYDMWRRFRGYTVENEGPILPGEHKKALEGYTFIHDAGDAFMGQAANDTYLMDPKGNRVHEWKHNGYSPEASVAYLLPNGQLLRTYSKFGWVHDKQFPVGATSSIELVDWDGNVLWEFTQSVAEKYSFHHDVEYLPNGNILAIRYNAFTIDEAKAMGWDPSLSSKAVTMIKNNPKKKKMIWMSNVLELKPNLEDGSTQIVWQWNSWDHLVQDKYPAKNNYGDITDSSKIHINYLNLDKDIPYNRGQVFHLNTVDYNAELDLIMLSSPTYGELWIIDHSTSMKEASESKGGKYNKGGDLLYRWGNDETFGKDIRDNTYLYWQHDTQWIGKGLPGAGNILIYNNGQRRDREGNYIKETAMAGWGECNSDILEIKIPMDSDGQFEQTKNAEIVWSWEHPDKRWYYSPFMSGATRLPNGNTIFNSAYDKYIIEVTPDGEMVEDYSLAGWGRLYRIYKFAPDYSGLKLSMN